MKCYVLSQGEIFRAGAKKAEVSSALEAEIREICVHWQARDLHQEGRSDDDYESTTRYEPLNEENFVVIDGKLVGYSAHHFDCSDYVILPIRDGKYRLGDYDFTNYSNSGRINRGHVAIVPRPDTDTNPYYDEPRFHSQEEYDDYIKWRD